MFKWLYVGQKKKEDAINSISSQAFLAIYKKRMNYGGIQIAAIKLICVPRASRQKENCIDKYMFTKRGRLTKIKSGRNQTYNNYKVDYVEIQSEILGERYTERTCMEERFNAYMNQMSTEIIPRKKSPDRVRNQLENLVKELQNTQPYTVNSIYKFVKRHDS